eukprot:50005-Amphidinium_carterae.1
MSTWAQNALFNFGKQHLNVRDETPWSPMIERPVQTEHGRYCIQQCHWELYVHGQRACLVSGFGLPRLARAPKDGSLRMLEMNSG